MGRLRKMLPTRFAGCDNFVDDDAHFGEKMQLDCFELASKNVNFLSPN